VIFFVWPQRQNRYSTAAPAWQWWAAFGGAVAIHLTAVAWLKDEAAGRQFSWNTDAVVEATMQATEEPTPPPEDIPLPSLRHHQEIQPEFVEETTPPPKKPTAQKFAPIKRHKLPVALDRCRSRQRKPCTYAPRPQYPYEARSRHVTGSGVCVVEVGPRQCI